MAGKVIFLTSFFALCTSSLIAGFEDPNEVQKWLPSKLHSKTSQVVNLLKTEQTESVRFDANTDFGFSVRGINPLQADCLQEISNQYAMQGVRPKVLDVAAGLGGMSWKTILAGGQVTAIGLQQKTAEQMRLHVVQKVKAISLENHLKKSIGLCVETL